MKLPSIHVLWLNLKNVVARFPLQVALAILATMVWWYLAGPHIPLGHVNLLGKLLLVCNLALTLLLAVDTYAESNLLAVRSQWLIRLTVLLFATGLYFWLDPYQYTNDIFKIALLAFAFHLLVAFSPFLTRGNLNGFWQYNKSLFLRFLISSFYAAVLFAGLAVALLAIEGLFNVNVKSYYYQRLFALVSAGFTTIFFLAGIPSSFAALDEEQTYPKGLKIFTQYVLIPLMSIYLTILLVYEVKIIINWELPKGLVSTLILGYAVFGILSLLLVHPIKEKEGNGWIKLFSKFFYLMMIPLVVLLILAVVKRVGNYGITESRYILIVLAAWLTGITIYFLFSKKQNIKVIPISLFVLSILAVYGPQSAVSVSKASQIARLARLMDTKSKKQNTEIPEVMRYLVQRHGLTAVQRFTKVNLSAVEEQLYAKAKKDNDLNYEIRRKKVDTAFALLNIKPDEYNNYSRRIDFDHENGKLISVKGYDAVVQIENYFTSSVIRFDGNEIELHNKSDDGTIDNAAKFIVKLKAKEISFDVKKLATTLMAEQKRGRFHRNKLQNFAVPAQFMQVSQQFNGYTFTFVVSDIYGYQDQDNDIEGINFNGYLLIKKN